jgi:heme A synthase
VRRLGLVALGAVIAQGLLGGLTVLFYLPVVISVAHATLAQIFFGTVVSVAIFTSRWWQSELPQLEDSGSPRVRSLALWTVAAVFFQLIVGAVFRHKGFGIVPHLIGAAVVTLLILWTAGVLRRRYPGVPALARCRRLLHALIGVQLLLGGAAWWSRWLARDFPQPVPMMVWLTVAHTVVGALVLAAAVATSLASFRLFAPGREVALASRPQKIQRQAAL